MTRKDQGSAARGGSPRLLSADQAAEMLGVPASWVLAQARRDAIPHIRLGRYVRFQSDDLRAWLDARSRGPRRPA